MFYLFKEYLNDINYFYGIRNNHFFLKIAFILTFIISKEIIIIYIIIVVVVLIIFIIIIILIIIIIQIDVERSMDLSLAYILIYTNNFVHTHLLMSLCTLPTISMDLYTDAIRINKKEKCFNKIGLIAVAYYKDLTCSNVLI